MYIIVTGEIQGSPRLVVLVLEAGTPVHQMYFNAGKAQTNDLFRNAQLINHLEIKCLGIPS